MIGSVDTSKAGVYQVSYGYGGLTKIATITVKVKDPTGPTDPTDPTDPTNPTDPTKPTLPITGGEKPTKPVKKPDQDQPTLPQTGEQQTHIAFWALVVVALSGVAAVHFWLRKRA